MTKIRPRLFMPYLTLAILLIVLLVAVPDMVARASLLSDITGSAQLSGISSSPSGDSSATRSLSQDYTVNWSRPLISYLAARATLRYYNLGIDQSRGANVWRRQYQPSGELSWNHPLFTISGDLQHQKTTGNDRTTNLIQNSSAISFATKALSLPILRFRYLWNHSYNSASVGQAANSDTTGSEPVDSTFFSARNTRDQLWAASLSYGRKNQDFYYNVSHSQNINELNGLEITSLQHLFRWNQTSMALDRRLRINSSYTLTYNSQTTSRPPTASVLRPIPYIASLYAYDATPDLGALDTLPALGDGNITTPVQPPVDLGQALLDRNIGVDFGFAREISALYIYTDRPSGSPLTWRIFTSADNFTWQQAGSAVVSRFNTSLNRYEIEFSPLTARYIKAVNGGANDVPTALVTEIETWDAFTSGTSETLHQTTHLVNLGGAYSWSKTLESSADLTYHAEPSGDFANSRDEIYYTFALRHSPKATITQSARFQGGTEKFKVTDARNTNTSLTYSLKLTPLKTLEFSFAALTRANYIDRVKTQEANNVFVQSKAQLLEALSVSGDAGYTRNNLFDSRNRFDTWTYHLSSVANLTSAIDATAGFMYQTTTTPLAIGQRIRRQYDFNLNYRLTATIYMSGVVAVNDEENNRFISQEYSANWNMSQKLSAGGMVTFNNNKGSAESSRGNARITYLISPRTTLFANYTSTDAIISGQGRVNAVQVGLQTGF